MNDLFIDCGANLGSVLVDFIGRLPGFTYFAFEPNKELHPAIHAHLKEAGQAARVTVSDHAVWTHDGTIDLFLGHHESSTVMPGKHVPPVYDQQIDYDSPVSVPCLDFSAWLRRTATGAGRVVIKMDIEGAEYPVLSRMLDDGTLDLVSTLYVEWHHDRFDYITTRRHRRLAEAVAERTEVLPWDSPGRRDTT